MVMNKQIIISCLILATVFCVTAQGLKGENQVNIIGYYGNAGSCADADCIPSLAEIHRAYNVIIFTFANFDSNNQVEWQLQGPYSWNKKLLKKDLASWKMKADPWGRTKHALISFGGQNGGWPMDNEDSVVVEKLHAFCKANGFDGVDVDLESGSISGVIKNLGAFRKLKEMGLLVSAAPEAAQVVLNAYKGLLPVLSWVHPQFYNNGPNAVIPPWTDAYKGYTSWQMNSYWAEVMEVTAKYVGLMDSQRGVCVPASTSAAGSYNIWDFEKLAKTCKDKGIKNIATWAIGYDNQQKWKLAKALLPLLTADSQNSTLPQMMNTGMRVVS